MGISLKIIVLLLGMGNIQADFWHNWDELPNPPGAPAPEESPQKVNPPPPHKKKKRAQKKDH